MAHVPVPAGVPGILSLFAFRPETAGPPNQLAEVLLRGPSTLSRGERELIASYVSSKNNCRFCCDSHSAFAAHQLEGGAALVEAVKSDPASAAISPKLVKLLVIAGQAQEGGRKVTADAVADAKAAGASDVEVHDTVLIAAAFCMFNRYVDGLGTSVPPDPAIYDMVARQIVEHGYIPTTPNRSDDRADAPVAPEGLRQTA
jgi:uncharacterized peroxidase-related enzyme